MGGKKSVLVSHAEKDDVLIDIGKDFSLQARVEGKDYIMHFTDYLRYAASFRDLSGSSSAVRSSKAWYIYQGLLCPTPGRSHPGKDTG